MTRNAAMYWATFVADHLPAGDHHQHGDEAVQQDEQHRYSVHAEVVVDVKAGNPGIQLDELHGARARLETGDERNRHEKADGRAEEARSTALANIPVADSKDDEARDDRDPYGKAEPVRRHLFLADERPSEKDEVREQHGNADDHEKRVVIDESGLDQAHHAGEPPDEPRRAVHHQTVYHGDVTEAPQAAGRISWRRPRKNQS